MKAGRLISILGLLVTVATSVWAQSTISLPLTTGNLDKIDLGTFGGGSQVQVSITGTGYLTSTSDYHTNPDGSLASAALGNYTFANAGATYPDVAPFPHGDEINHFSGGGANYDFSGSGWMFAGSQTTDTTDSTIIRAGAVVGTFMASPSRADWFIIGYGGTFTVPNGGADLFVAVNETNSTDNHGSYSLTFAAIPEPATAAVWLAAALGGVAIVRRSRRRA